MVAPAAGVAVQIELIAAEVVVEVSEDIVWCDK